MSFEFCFHPIKNDFIQAPEIVLSASELMDFTKISHPQRQQEFLQSRYHVKAYLQKYLHKPMSQIEFTIVGEGKPVCADFAGDLNWSHTDKYLTAVFSDTLKVGVDLEVIHRKGSYQDLASRVLTVFEQELLLKHTLEDQHLIFWKFWTAKEAILKAAAGGGFRNAVQIEINPLTGHITKLPASFSDISNWTLSWDLPAVGYIRAAAGYLPST